MPIGTPGLDGEYMADRYLNPRGGTEPLGTSDLQIPFSSCNKYTVFCYNCPPYGNAKGLKIVHKISKGKRTYASLESLNWLLFTAWGVVTIHTRRDPNKTGKCL